MISSERVTQYIQESIPGATVRTTDLTGTMDHWRVEVLAEAFRGRSLLDRHRMIYQALDEPMKDGRIHAVELRATTPEGN